MKRIFLVSLLVLMVAAIPLVQAEGGTTTAILTDDTYWSIIGGSPPEYGIAPTLKAGLLTNTFLKFNISSIPDGAMGITAVLELYTAYNGVPKQHLVAVYPLENTTWNEHDGIFEGMYPQDLEMLDEEWIANEETWYEWNVTKAVVEVLSNSSNIIAFVMTYPEFGGEVEPVVSFVSKEGSITKIPKLTITWTDVIPEFPSLIMPLVMVATTAVSLIVKKRALF